MDVANNYPRMRCGQIGHWSADPNCPGRKDKKLLADTTPLDASDWMMVKEPTVACSHPCGAVTSGKGSNAYYVRATCTLCEAVWKKSRPGSSTR